MNRDKRKTVIAANWKMHKNRAETEAFIAEFSQAVLPEILSQNREIIIAAPFTLLDTLVRGFQNSSVHVAAENMYFEENGAFTGEISPLHLKDIGVTHVIIGHSERRHIFGEDNHLLHQKLVAAHTHGITPIYCVGETLDERDSGHVTDVVVEQLLAGIDGLEADFIEKMIVAYEPVWAIGTGRTASPEEAEEIHTVIRKHLPEATPLLYGGSVKPENAKELLEKPSIDGFLVGGASLEAASFAAIACS